MVAEEARALNSRAFSTCGCSLKMVTSFKYLGRVLLEMYDDWTALVRSIVKARTLWRRMSRILSREGASLRVSGFFP